MTREEAILSLWRQAVSELTIVHLDKEAWVHIDVLRVLPATVHGNLVIGQIRIENARDTAFFDQKTNGVSLPWKAHGWPGREFVHSFIAACWSSVMAHEGLETVLRAGKRVHDPHTTTIRVDEGTHLATTGRERELVRRFIGDIEPISPEESEEEILLCRRCNSVTS